MFGHVLRGKQGGGKLFAFFTILFIAGAIWAYFLLYLPAMDVENTNASTLEPQNSEKLAKLENSNRIKELVVLLVDIEKLLEKELYKDADVKIKDAHAILDVVKDSEGFNRDEYAKKLQKLEREKNLLSVENTIKEIELLTANEVYVDAYEKIQGLEDKSVTDDSKEQLQKLRQTCEEKISGEIFIEIESLVKAGDLYKAVEMVEMADLFNFKQPELLEKIKKYRTDIDAKINAITSATAKIITKAQKAIENKQYEEALKIIEAVKLDSIIVEDQRRDIALIKSQANINLDYAKIQYDANAYFVDGFITIEVRTIAGVEYFGQMIEEDYNLLRNPPTKSTDENSKVIVYTYTPHHDDRKIVMLGLSEIADYIAFTVSEVDESFYAKEIKEWESDIRTSRSKVDKYKLAKYIKSVSNKSEDIKNADVIVESLTRYNFNLWQTLEPRRSDIFKTCVTNIIKDNLTDAKEAFKTISKLYPYAEGLWLIEHQSFDERFDDFKKFILDELDSYFDITLNDSYVELNAFQKKLVENDKSGVINYADNAYSLALKQLKDLNKYGVSSVRQLKLAGYYCRLAIEMLNSIIDNDNTDKVYDMINKIHKDLYLIQILSEY